MPANRRKPADLRQNRITHDLQITARDVSPALFPQPPRGLLTVTQDRWSEFWRSDVSQAIDMGSDRGRLDRWIRYWDEWERAMRTIRKDGRVVEGSKGQPRLSPLVAYVATLETAIAAAERELGLTPKARADLGLTFAQAKRSIADLNAALDDEADDELVGDGSVDYIEVGA